MREDSEVSEAVEGVSVEIVESGVVKLVTGWEEVRVNVVVSESEEN